MEKVDNDVMIMKIQDGCHLTLIRLFWFLIDSLFLSF